MRGLVIIVWLLAVASGAWADTSHDPFDAALPGDLIFREGTETVSAVVLAVDGGTYSHVGMLVGQPGAWQVLHATPSEMPGRPDGVVLDTLDFFVDAARSKSYAVYRVQADPTQRAAALTSARAMLGRPFRIADATGTYCTELVWRAWMHAGVDMDVSFTPLNLPLLPGKYLLPGALLASDKLQMSFAAGPSQDKGTHHEGVLLHAVQKNK